MDFIYRGKPYQCISTVLPNDPLRCITDSLVYEDDLFD